MSKKLTMVCPGCGRELKPEDLRRWLHTGVMCDCGCEVEVSVSKGRAEIKLAENNDRPV